MSSKRNAQSNDNNGGHGRNAFQTPENLLPFTPKRDQFQISPAASPKIQYHTVWRTWLFKGHSNSFRWKVIITASSHYLTYNGWENVLFELGSERVKKPEPNRVLVSEISELARTSSSFRFALFVIRNIAEGCGAPPYPRRHSTRVRIKFHNFSWSVEICSSRLFYLTPKLGPGLIRPSTRYRSWLWTCTLLAKIESLRGEPRESGTSVQPLGQRIANRITGQLSCHSELKSSVLQNGSFWAKSGLLSISALGRDVKICFSLGLGIREGENPTAKHNGCFCSPDGAQTQTQHSICSTSPLTVPAVDAEVAAGSLERSICIRELNHRREEKYGHHYEQRKDEERQLQLVAIGPSFQQHLGVIRRLSSHYVTTAASKVRAKWDSIVEILVGERVSGEQPRHRSPLVCGFRTPTPTPTPTPTARVTLVRGLPVRRMCFSFPFLKRREMKAVEMAENSLKRSIPIFSQGKSREDFAEA